MDIYSYMKYKIEVTLLRYNVILESKIYEVSDEFDKNELSKVFSDYNTRGFSMVGEDNNDIIIPFEIIKESFLKIIYID